MRPFLKKEGRKFVVNKQKKGAWCNGSIPVSKTVDVSSNLAAPAKRKHKKMNSITTYFREAYDELMNKVTWPSWAELQESSVIVLVTAILISLLVVGMDIAFKYGTSGIYKLIIGG